MAIASSHTMANGANPPAPPAGYVKIFIDSVGVVKTIDSNGTVTTVGGTASGDMSTTIYDPNNVAGDVFDLSSHTGSIDAVQVTVDDDHRFVTVSQITDWDNKEDSFSKFSAFNKDFAGTGSASTVARSDHNHDPDYESKEQPASDDQIKVYDSDGSTRFEDKPQDPSSPMVLHVQDQKSQGDPGGTFSSGGRRTRDLNAVVLNTISGASLISNVITLPAGTYEFKAEIPCVAVGGAHAWLYNITAASDELHSTSLDSGNSQVNMYNFISGWFTLSTTSALEVQHRCETTKTTYGFGKPSGLDTEVYTNVVIKKLVS